MMATVGPGPAPIDALGRFRALADAGRIPLGAKRTGHKDGWGIVRYVAGIPSYVGRSPADAATDPAFPVAIAQLERRPPSGVVLAHLRRASQGDTTLENTQPFVHGAMAFCHNGTIRGLAPRGESDSRLFFERIVSAARTMAMPDAIQEVTRDLRARFVHTSLTSMLTDGRTLWALRAIGNDPAACVPSACPQDYFTLGFGRIGDTVVVSQESAYLSLVGEWVSVPDGSLLEVSPGAPPRVRPLLP